VVACVLLGGLATRGQDSTPPPVDDLVAAIQARYDTVHDFSTDFEHRYSGGVLRTTAVEHGTVYVKKPGKWRFDYTAPEKKLYVSDGETLHAYFPADRQVIVSQMEPDTGASTPALFLAGQGDLARDFTVTYPDTTEVPPNSWFVRLTPTRGDTDYEWLTLALDPNTLAIRQMVAFDFQGAHSSFTFLNLKENQGLSDNLFVFEIPRDTDVITDESFPR